MASLGREGSGTVIGLQVKLTGTLSDPNDILILGKVDGEIHSDTTVTVGVGADVKGPITAARVVVGGTVQGNITTRERLEILPRGIVNGNIETRDLIIQSGAIFNGRSTIIPSRETGPQPPQGLEEPSASGASPEAPAAPTPAVPRRTWPPIRLAAPTFRREIERKIEEKEQEKEKPPYEIE